MKLHALQFTVARLMHSTAWFAVAAVLFSLLPPAGQYPSLSHLLAVLAAVGAGLGAIIGRPISGAMTILLFYFMYALLFPDIRE